MIRKSIVSAITMVLLVLIYSQAKGDWGSFPISESVSEQSEPDISGDRVVWTDNRIGGYDIYSYDLSEPNEYPIDTAGGDQSQPAISGDIIVWTDNNNIIGYDLSGTGKFTVCANDADQNYPAIDGNMVVWRDKRNFSGNSYDIYGGDISDISEPNVFAICTESHGQYYPNISGNIVIWIDVRNSGSQPDIYGYNLSTKEEFEICTNASGQYNPKISSDVVVWVDDRNGDNDIYGYRISTQTEFPICTHNEKQSNPKISGNLVIWQDERNGDTNSDIYGYNIAGGSGFSVCTMPGGQINPAVDGDTVVWQQGTSSSADVYGANRPAVPLVLTILSPNGGEMLLAGSAAEITWQSNSPEIENVRLDYSTNMGGNWNLIMSSTTNTGSFEWDSVPVEDSEQSLVRVRDVGCSGASDVSNEVFTIFECSGSLIADINDDCFVDIKDFALFCQQWLLGGNPYDPAWPNEK